mgnify:CR=1 FL=1
MRRFILFMPLLVLLGCKREGTTQPDATQPDTTTPTKPEPADEGAGAVADEGAHEEVDRAGNAEQQPERDSNHDQFSDQRA